MELCTFRKVNVSTREKILFGVFVTEDQALTPFQTNHLTNFLFKNLTNVLGYFLYQSLLVVETQVLSGRIILEIAIKIANLFSC